MSADFSRWLCRVCGLVAAAVAGSVHAGVVTDGTVGPRVHRGGDFEIGADLGRQAGRNLFHSFERFSLDTGERATFSGPDDIRNVISRVTGGARSDIDGTIASTIPGADIYFINPAGVVFGPNASLGLQGSFHVSTADELRFADGATFSATDPNASSFTVAAPEAFGFLGAAPGAITVDRSTFEVDTEKSLSVVGGSLEFRGAGLSAPSGRINIASVASAGQVTPTPQGLDTDGFSALGPIRLVEGANVSTRGDPGGRVLIRGDRLIIDNAGFEGTNTAINAGTTGDLDGARVGIDIRVVEDVALNKAEIVSSSFGAGRAGDIRIVAGRLLMVGDSAAGDPNGLGSNIASRVFGSGDAGQIHITTESLELEANAVISTQVTTVGSGDAGDILIEADDLEIDGTERTAFIDTSTFGSGSAGNLRVLAKNITLIGGDASFAVLASGGATGDAGSVTVQADALEVRAGGRIGASTFGEGDAGTVQVTAGELGVRDGGQILSSTFGEGNAGTVTVAAERILISGDRGFSIILSTAEPGSSGDAGAVTVTAANLELRGGGVIISDTFAEGDAGTVAVQAERLLISDDGGSKVFTGIGSRAREGSTGAGGTVTVKAGELEVRGGSRISTDTFAEGDAGTVTVEAERLLIVGDGTRRFAGISSNQFNPGATGAAGVVTVRASELDLRRHGAISSDTLGEGDAGLVTVEAGRLRIVGDGSGFFTGITSSSQPGGRGDAGSVAVTADNLEIRSGGITSSTFGVGDAGRVVVDAGRLHIVGNASGFLTGIATTTDFGSTGAAGSVIVTAPTIILADRGSIASFSRGTGQGGRVTIRARDTFRSTGGRVTAQTAEGGADAGDVAITVGWLIDLVDSTVSTSAAAGQGSGGNIFIDPVFIILDGSRIGARAREGAGGNIRIVADNFIVSPDSVIDASSELGIDGNVEIDAPDEDISGELVVLEGALLDASSLLRERCAARRDIGASSFTGVGRGGLPPSPEGPLASPYTSGQGSQVLAVEAEKSKEQGQLPRPLTASFEVPCRGAF